MEPKQGLSHARNRGVAEASGSFVVFTDDDITVPPDWAARYLEVIDGVAADCVFGRIVPNWNGPRPPWYDTGFKAMFGDLDYGPTQFNVTTRNFEFFGANFGCRRALMQEIGGFDPSLGRTPAALYISEERQVFLRLLTRGSLIVYSPSIWVQHEISEEMKTKDYVRRYYRDTATSLVTIVPVNPDRQFLGVPYYRWLESAQLSLFFIPRAAVAVATGCPGRLFPLWMELQRSLRVLLLHSRRWLARDSAGK
jgi:glycosyltransferase involved in cell wall biosynthesis